MVPVFKTIGLKLCHFFHTLLCPSRMSLHILLRRRHRPPIILLDTSFLRPEYTFLLSYVFSSINITKKPSAPVVRRKLRPFSYILRCLFSSLISTSLEGMPKRRRDTKPLTSFSSFSSATPSISPKTVT